ncbi:UNVERIFIED_CONTAM: universal stress protein UspA [Euhalothece sp. KZN 001]
MYTDILVPTDGSTASTTAVEHAIDLASHYDATLHVLYVVDVTGYSALEVGADVVANALEEEGEDAVGDVIGSAEAMEIDTESMIQHGTPHRAIIDYATAEAVDLVVMGTHGRTGVGRFLLGSVTERVVRTSPVPVLTVRGDEAMGE